MTTDYRLRISEIVNAGLKETEFDFDIQPVSPGDIDLANFWDIKNIIQFTENKNPVNRIFIKLSKDRYSDYGQFHHFKGVRIALQIIANKSIQISSLFSNDQNDFAEYTEFYKRLGLYHPLLPNDYYQQHKENKFEPGS